jgi:hypothetical protein
LAIDYDQTGCTGKNGIRYHLITIAADPIFIDNDMTLGIYATAVSVFAFRTGFTESSVLVNDDQAVGMDTDGKRNG